MTEERKHAILFATTLLCARKLIETMESSKADFAKQFWVDKAVDEAAFILERNRFSLANALTQERWWSILPNDDGLADYCSEKP